MSNSDTIVAMATPMGESAVAMLRASGPLCRQFAETLFDPKRSPTPRRSLYGTYLSNSGEGLDDVVYCYYQGPHSYTGEDTLEISCHGNPLIASRILEDLMRRGCRQAEPGEFTRRSFLNGRMDLTQAEAVMELIQARSDRAIQAATNQLRGAFGKQLETLKEQLLSIVANTEAYIDFPDEDLPDEQRDLQIKRIREMMTYCGRIIDSSKYAAFLRDGVKTLILGEPNAGKSSLLNAMLGFDRAIVSAEPGTTRDFLRERIIVGSHSIQLMDTAGLRDAESGIERQGILKTQELAEECDVFLLVVDATQPSPTLPEAIAQRLSPENCIVIRNKMDLEGSQPLSPELAPYSTVDLSALTGAGLDDLKAALIAMIDARFSGVQDDLILVNARHNAALQELKACLAAAIGKFEMSEPPELIASDMRGAMDAIGRILGRIDNERMLDVLFSSFCIGK